MVPSVIHCLRHLTIRQQVVILFRKCSMSLSLLRATNVSTSLGTLKPTWTASVVQAMQLCSPLTRPKLLRLNKCALLRVQSANLVQCTLSRSCTWSHVGPTSSPSTSRTLHYLSRCPLPRPSPIYSLNSHSSNSWEPLIDFQLRLYSSKRWQARQTTDPYTRLAKLQDLKSRAAFKLLQINDRYRLFRPGQTVVDLGFAPGSWSQVAIDFVKPNGRVLGVDLIPAQPPKGVSAIQGDFRSEEVREEVRRFVTDESRGRLRRPTFATLEEDKDMSENEGYIDLERVSHEQERSEQEESCVDVVLSDMSEPWDLVEGHHKRTLSNPYRRMINTSGNAFRDHVGSMVSPIHAFNSSPSWPITHPTQSTQDQDPHIHHAQSIAIFTGSDICL